MNGRGCYRQTSEDLSLVRRRIMEEPLRGRLLRITGLMLLLLCTDVENVEGVYSESSCCETVQ